MSLFLLFYKGVQPMPQKDLDVVGGMAGVEVRYISPGAVVTLEITSDIAVQKLKAMKDWKLYESQTVEVDLGPSDNFYTENVPHLRIVK